MKSSLFLFLFVTILPVFSSAEICNRIVAIVNGDIITLYELNKKVKQITGKDPDFLKKNDEEKYRKICKNILNRLIEDKLTEKKVKELGIKVSDTDVDEEIRRIEEEQGLTHEEFIRMLEKSGVSYDEYRKYVKKSIERMQLIEFEVRSRIVISEEQIRDYYEKHKDEFKTAEKVRIASIFLKLKNRDDPEEMERLKKRAEVIIERLKEGEEFSELAEDFSEGPGAESGGDLGYFKIEDLDPEIRRLVEKMKIGEVSDPIIRPFGIQIIKVLDKKAEGVKPLEEVRDYIYRILYNKEIEKRYTSWINELKKRSYIKIMF